MYNLLDKLVCTSVIFIIVVFAIQFILFFAGYIEEIPESLVLQWT